MADKTNKYDMSSIVANIEKVKQMKAPKEKKPSTSLRPLKFDVDPDDSPLKQDLVRRINEKNLTYSDLYAYCTKVKNGDIAEGQKFGYNLISGLKNRRSMIDTTYSLLIDFLELELVLVERKKDDDVDDEKEED